MRSTPRATSSARRRGGGQARNQTGADQSRRLGPHGFGDQGIDAGYVVGVIQQDPAGMGAAAVDALAKLLSGGSVDKLISVPVTIVTKDNVEAFRAAFQ
jgi:hypothetical protein